MGYDPDDCQYTYREFEARNAELGANNPFFSPWDEIKRLRSVLVEAKPHVGDLGIINKIDAALDFEYRVKFDELSRSR